jgi:hypothetical protein
MSNTMTTNRRSNTSILPDHYPKIPEIQGYYWPRVLLEVHDNEPVKGGKKVEKKVIKAVQRRRKTERYQNTASYQQVVGLALKSPLFDLSYSPTDVPSLVSEDPTPQTTRPQFSPVTGRPVITMDAKWSRLIPMKPVRKQHRSRARSNSQSNPTVATG